MKDRPRRVLFLCTGNTCRSPLAEVIARESAARRGLDLEFLSAGIIAASGVPASEGAEIVALRRGLDLGSHRSSPLTRELARDADLILGMDDGHLRQAEHLAPEVPRRLLTEYLPDDDSRRGCAVPDPFGGWTSSYEEAYGLIEASVARLLDHLGGLDPEARDEGA